MFCGFSDTLSALTVTLSNFPDALRGLPKFNMSPQMLQAVSQMINVAFQKTNEAPQMGFTRSIWEVSWGFWEAT